MQKQHIHTDRVLWGDCVKTMAHLPEQCANLIVTDPPYLVNYTDRTGRRIAGDGTAEWVKPAFRQIFRVLKRDSFCVCFYGWNRAEIFLDAWKEAGFKTAGHFVWAKKYPSRTGYVRAHHEQAYLLAKGRPGKPVNPPRDVLYNWRYTGNRLHPTQKPVEAVAPLIEAYSKPGDIVLDPFAGSGTTLVAARRCGRKAIGIELDWNHCRTANGRLIREA